MHHDQELSGVPIIGGPHDGNEDDALISDGELCGKIFFTDFAPNHVHTYELTYNNDDGFRFIYQGLKPYSVDDNGNYQVEE